MLIFTTRLMHLTNKACRECWHMIHTANEMLNLLLNPIYIYAISNISGTVSVALTIAITTTTGTKRTCTFAKRMYKLLGKGPAAIPLGWKIVLVCIESRSCCTLAATRTEDSSVMER